MFRIEDFRALLKRERTRLGQDRFEWLAFLEFVDSFFGCRSVTRPVVVEIGTLRCAQRPFYTRLLDAEYVGIDVDPLSGANIVGDSHDNGTFLRLVEILGGRRIDLLFIDGDHTYASVRRDYELYGPLARWMVAFHDLFCDNDENTEVRKLWDEIRTVDTESAFLTFHRRRSHEKTGIWDGHEMGIGLMVKAGM